MVVIPVAQGSGGGGGEERVLYLKGKVRVQVLSGSLHCMGFEMTCEEGSEEGACHHVFSPRGYSLLGLAAAPRADPPPPRGKRPAAQLKGRLRRLGFEGKALQDVSARAGEAPAVVAVFSKLSDSLDRLPVPGEKGRMSLFGRDETLPRMLSVPSFCPHLEKLLDVNLFEGTAVPGLRYFRALPEWEEFVHYAREATKERGSSSRILVMGGKGVGKSSLTKYLCNRLLSSSSLRSVLYVNLDPGQTEFTVPGCVSASVVTRPILGPNFCHLDQRPVTCVYVGDVSASSMRRRYLDAVSHLADVCRAAGNMETAWVINSMGFSSGLGLPLLKAASEQFSPTVVVSIESRFEAKNFPEDFKRNLIDKSQEVFHFPAVPEVHDSEMSSQDLWGIPQPRSLRDLVVMAYFRMPKIEVTINWRDVYLQSLCQDLPSSQLLKALEHGLVALCRTNGAVEFKDLGRGLRLLSHRWIGECLGFGIVLSVDARAEKLTLTTPLKLEELNGTDCLSLGAVIIPDVMLKKWWQPAVEAERRRKGQPLNPLTDRWAKSSRPKAK